MTRARGTPFVIHQAEQGVARASALGLMHSSFRARSGKKLVLRDGREVVEFVNCSYLGLDTHPRLIEGAKRALDEYGVHFCCARSRLSIEPNVQLEAKLSEMFRARAITFPSVTAAHLSTLPLVASGELLPDGYPRATRFAFDKNAHASMQLLRPIIERDAHQVDILPHNDLDAIEACAKAAVKAHQTLVYLADGVYSMGGLSPVGELTALAERYPMVLYLDDAHGTSIFGRHGEGFARGAWPGALPESVIIAFSLAKGFGCNGGGVLLSTARQERRVRHFGVTYCFSAPLDFSVVGAALEAVELHFDGTVEALQKTLRARVGLLDRLVGTDTHDFSPIRRVAIGDEDAAREAGEQLLRQGLLVSVAFFPVVGRGRAQVRLCLSVQHTDEQIQQLARALAESLAALGDDVARTA
jgi:8-amino-7-oxononanoate synthase